MSFHLPEIDSALPAGGLTLGAVHEWTFENDLEVKSKGIWYPPLFLLSALLGRGFLSAHQVSASKTPGLIAWVGKYIWPTPHLLNTTLAHPNWDWNANCLFLDPQDKDDRLRSSIQLLNSPLVSVAVLDGSGLNLTATRRLQLAAQKHSALCLLLCPPWQIKRISSAQSKWKVSPYSVSSTVSSTKQAEGEADFMWTLELLSAKGLPAPLEWNLQWSDGDGGSEGSETSVDPEPEREAYETGTLHLFKEHSGELQPSSARRVV